MSYQSMTDVGEKTDRYERLLERALDTVEDADRSDPDTVEVLEMAESYLEDGRHFLEEDDVANALASFSYGHGWLDAGARMGLYEVETEW